MIVSHGELDAEVRKAFRGAGYHWGEAEEAGKAAVWLARNKLAPAALTLSLLRAAADNVARLRPAPDRLSWAIGGAETCPLLAGIALADDAANMLDFEQVSFARLHAPGFLLPFLGQLALDRNIGFRLSLPRMEVTVSARRMDVSGLLEALASPLPAKLLAVEPVPGTNENPAARTHSTEVSRDDWDSLSEFAMKTYVPASDHSRLAGAGAGVLDSD